MKKNDIDLLFSIGVKKLDGSQYFIYNVLISHLLDANNNKK